MAFDHQSWNRRFIADLDYNDAAVNYGVGIFRHSPASGERYWRIIGIHHLLPDENRGGHNLFFDVLDINGNRVRPIVWINWSWDGMRPDEQPPFAQGDKPDTEPAGNIALGSVEQIVYAGCNGRNTTLNTDGNSDWIQKVHTNHPDEGDAEGNTIGHHSFYVLWKETEVGEVVPDPEPIPDPQPDPIPNPDPEPPIPIPDSIIGIVTTWQGSQKLQFQVPWQAEVFDKRPEDDPYLEVLVIKERLQKIIDETDGNESRLYIELRRDDENTTFR
ncbi:hypothetical protein LCGC14_2857350 [marine sediment metagenome]|uniref:Uncharacterized protein n=1 Tax=marine sediment metagenome TaxID=412755 RepID=A0A0F8Y6V4_9ZZZZ